MQGKEEKGSSIEAGTNESLDKMNVFKCIFLLFPLADCAWNKKKDAFVLKVRSIMPFAAVSTF